MLTSSRLRWCRCKVCILTGFLLALPASSLLGQGGGTPKKSQYQNYLSQLKSRFQQWDLDSDSVLNKAELAKGFRGPDAKPYDYVAPDDTTNDPAKAKKGKVKTTALALVCLPRPGLAVNLTLAELLSQPKAKPKDKTLNPAVLQYGDFQFLALIGKDDQIAKQDYDSWCMGYARNLDQLQTLQRQVTVSLEKLAKAKSAKQKQSANNELAKHQADLAAVNAQLSGVTPAIQAGLNVKR
jgi:hypothetical protein